MKTELSRSARTRLVTLGAQRYFADHGLFGVAEVRLTRQLRCDLLLVSPKGEITLVEVKSGAEDYRADQKWRGYLEWCDAFLFAVDLSFPLETLPEEVGVLRTDGREGALARPPLSAPLAPARRKALLIKLTLAASERLYRRDDPDFGGYSEF